MRCTCILQMAGPCDWMARRFFWTQSCKPSACACSGAAEQEREKTSKLPHVPWLSPVSCASVAPNEELLQDRYEGSDSYVIWLFPMVSTIAVCTSTLTSRDTSLASLRPGKWAQISGFKARVWFLGGPGSWFFVPCLPTALPSFLPCRSWVFGGFVARAGAPATESVR